MSTLVEKTTQKLQRKIRDISNEALPELLAVGTGAEPTAGKLEGVIDGLDAKLCKAVARSYPKIFAAAVVEKHRLQAPHITHSTEVERPVEVRKGEPMTDAKSAARARRRALKAKRKAEQAEASAAEARERLNKGTDMDSMIVIAKVGYCRKAQRLHQAGFLCRIAEARRSDPATWRDKGEGVRALCDGRSERSGANASPQDGRRRGLSGRARRGRRRANDKRRVSAVNGSGQRAAGKGRNRRAGFCPPVCRPQISGSSRH